MHNFRSSLMAADRRLVGVIERVRSSSGSDPSLRQPGEGGGLLARIGRDLVWL
jgi:hypothetical protein